MRIDTACDQISLWYLDLELKRRQTWLEFGDTPLLSRAKLLSLPSCLHQFTIVINLLCTRRTDCCWKRPIT